MTGSLQIKNDSFYAVLNFKDKAGNRKQKWIPLKLPVKGNKRKAEKALSDLLIQYQGIEYVEPMNIPLAQHIADWIELDKANIARTTYDQYVAILNYHIIPYFNARGITVSSLTPGDLEDYYNAKVSEGLSPNTVIKHHAIIRSALQWAVKHRYIRENVADIADKPTRVKYHSSEPYTVYEVAQLLNLTQQDPIGVPIFLAAFYGLRRSEALGVRWSSINLQTGMISISTTVVKENHDGNTLTVVREDMTKTETSMRSLPLCPYTHEFFINVKHRQDMNREALGPGYDPRYLDFVCVNDRGTLLNPDFVSQKFSKILEAHGLRHIRFHDLRHSCATIMLYLGYTMKDIQTWLGHSNYNFTANTYVHSNPEAHVQMADAYSEKLAEIIPVTGPSGGIS